MTEPELVIRSPSGRVTAILRYEGSLSAADRELVAECRRAIEQVFRERSA